MDYTTFSWCQDARDGATILVSNASGDLVAKLEPTIYGQIRGHVSGRRYQRHTGIFPTTQDAMRHIEGHVAACERRQGWSVGFLHKTA